MTFTYEVAPGVYSSGINGHNDSTVVPPVIPNIDLTFKSSDTGVVANGQKTTIKQSGNILSGLTFTDAGVYTYKIKEKNNTVTLTASETLAYDNSEYTLRVYVVRNPDGSLKVDGATVEKGAEATANKVDASPGTAITGGAVTSQARAEVTTANGFTFLNVYNKTTSLEVSKTVTGSLSNINDEFTYTILLTPNDLISGKTFRYNYEQPTICVTRSNLTCWFRVLSIW